VVVEVPLGLGNRHAAYVAHVHFPHLGEARHELGREYANVAHEAGDRAHREGASRETKQEDLISFDVVVGNKVVDLSDVVIEAQAETTYANRTDM